MLIAHYVGPAKPGILPWIGWQLTVLGQKGPHDRCTHTEAVHEVHGDGTVTIASSSLHDKGVRTKRTALNRDNWVITDVPMWDVQESIDFFAEAISRGVQYDKRGALATLLPGNQDARKLFCTESVLAPFVDSAHYFSPALGLALCLSLGRDVTSTPLWEAFHR
jgi:hypothetical protein